MSWPGAAADTLPDGVYAAIYTPKGAILLKLEYEKTPVTVANFVGLAEGTKNHNRASSKLFYDGLTFHRVVPTFVSQGGDPTGTGSGGPGYAFRDEFHASLTHNRVGILSMANSGPATNGSQFFITHSRQPHLNNKHSVFGSTLEGDSVVVKLVNGDKMDSIRISRYGAKAKQFIVTEAFFQALLKGTTSLSVPRLRLGRASGALSLNGHMGNAYHLLFNRDSEAGASYLVSGRIALPYNPR